ncbi:MAG: hypothetical protein AAGA11_03810 [Pseudomonadota bacterium]
MKPCAACGRSPRQKDDWESALSQGGYTPVDPTSTLAHSDARRASPVYQAIARKSLDSALADTQLRELLQLDFRAASPAAAEAVPDSAASIPESAPVARPTGVLLSNPFLRLGAGPRDRASSVRERASQCSEESGNALADVVLDPHRRLHAELRWLGDSTADEVRALIERTDGVAAGLDPIARVNLESEWLAREDPCSAATLAAAVLHADVAFAQPDLDALCERLNRARVAAGVAVHEDADLLAEAMEARVREAVSTFIALHDRLTPSALLESFALFCVAGRTPNAVVRSLVNHYRQFAEPVLVSEGDKVVALCRRGADHVRRGTPLAPGLVDRLAALLSLYHRVLSPIRHSGQGLGVARTLSRLMREAFEDLCEAAQSHADADTAAQLSGLQNRYFRSR